MEKMYQDYKDIVEFRMIYISEAHAADGTWSVPYAKELGLTEHKSYGQRCSQAQKLLSDKTLTIPTLADGMDDKVNEAYKAWPDRIYLVRKDGKLAVATDRGPRGYVPAMEAAKEWLVEYKKTGKEPALPEKKADGK